MDADKTHTNSNPGSGSNQDLRRYGVTTLPAHHHASCLLFHIHCLFFINVHPYFCEEKIISFTRNSSLRKVLKMCYHLKSSSKMCIFSASAS